MAKKKQQSMQVTAPIKLDVKPDTPAYYANYASVSNSTPYDFVISLARVPSPFSEADVELVRKNKVVLVEPMMHIIISPDFAPKLVEALNKHLKIYNENKEKAKENERKQQRHNGASDVVH